MKKLSHATGTGVATLAVPFPTGSQFAWAIGIGLLAAAAGQRHWKWRG